MKPRKGSTITGGIFLLMTLSGCMTPAQRLDKAAILEHLHQGQPRQDVRRLVGTPKSSEQGSNGKKLETYLINIPGSFVELRVLSVLYDEHDRVENFVHHAGKVMKECAFGKCSGGVSLTPEKLAEIRRDITTREDLVRLFGPETVERLNVEGDKVVEWLSVEGDKFGIKSRVLSVLLDAKSLVKNFGVHNRN